ncbi:hypothetical protein [Sphingomonas hylomeconis]|uniref:Uncharacterized protein n=1 Tax=Sphingomonas hylomeconis TaxID=1395958 RepID=A0ABV7SZ33_9SPHN|nr:hypothetical protein [Sphingomonas hylomeconis]
MNALEVYQKLYNACDLLDREGDHAIAAYVGLAMALLADKYGIDTDEAGVKPDGAHVAHLASPSEQRGSSWA